MTVSTASTLKDVFASWNQAFKELEDRQELITPVNFGGEDPLVLSWAAYNQWTDGGYSRFPDFSSIKPTDADYSLAEQTRTYYRDRMAIKALKGIDLTKFQNALYAMLTQSEYTSDQIGMLYKLPYFYIEDQAHERLVAKSHPIKSFSVPGQTRVATITPAERILVSRRSAERYEYWFYDSNQHPACLVVAANNPIRSMIEGLYNRQRPITLKANWYGKHMHHRPDFRFWLLGSPEIAF